MKKIICGFAGIGKSYLAKNKEGYVDLESTPFGGHWNMYTNVAIHMQKSGYVPLMSCHKELRKMLKEKGVDYVVVIPRVEHKANYIKRYKDRGNDSAFLALLEDNFKKWIEEIVTDEENLIVLANEYTTLSDIINHPELTN